MLLLIFVFFKLRKNAVAFFFHLFAYRIETFGRHIKHQSIAIKKICQKKIQRQKHCDSTKGYRRENFCSFAFTFK
jgi:hypothetical protein